jgi:hypothetical protein
MQIQIHLYNGKWFWLYTVYRGHLPGVWQAAVGWQPIEYVTE